MKAQAHTNCVLCSEEELDQELGVPLMLPGYVREPRDLSRARTIVTEAAAEWTESVDVITPTVEALGNALRHAGKGAYQACARGEMLQVLIWDTGPGIDPDMLPLLLQRGYSTEDSLGMGFTIMMETCSRVLLATQPGRTSIVLEFTRG